MTPIQEANLKLFNRYLKRLQRAVKDKPVVDTEDPTSDHHLLQMCTVAIDRPEMYLDKQSRWLGYVQGIMAVRGYIDVSIERQMARIAYHQAYRSIGLPIPETISVEVNRGMIQ